MPSWNVHLDICRRIFNLSYCTEDLKVLDELIDYHVFHDVGRKDRQRDPLRLSALLAECCLCLGNYQCGEESFKHLVTMVKEKISDIESYLLNLAERAMDMILSRQFNEDLEVARAVNLFGIAASVYIRDFAIKGSEGERIILAWYLSTGSILSISGRELAYVLLHHVVDLIVEYIPKETVSIDAPRKVLGRVRRNEVFNEVVNKLDYIVCGLDSSRLTCYSPSKLLGDLMKKLEIHVREIYSILAYDRALKGKLPGSEAWREEILVLISSLRFAHGFKGIVVVNEEPSSIMGAASKVAKLLEERKSVEMKFFDKRIKSDDIESNKAQPLLVIKAKTLSEFKNKVCSEIPEEIFNLANYVEKPALSKVKEICHQVKNT